MAYKEEFITRLAEKGHTKTAIREIYDDFVDTIEDFLIEGETVNFHGFAALRVCNAPARRARNINTGEPMIIEAHPTVKIKLSPVFLKALKDGRIERRE